MSTLPQDFGALTPGIRYAVADGIIAANATQIYTKFTVFETVTGGGIARLPRTNSADVEVGILNRCGTGEILTIIPDTGGQIEDYGIDTPVGIIDGGAAILVCLDPVIMPGKQWWVSCGSVIPLSGGFGDDGGVLYLLTVDGSYPTSTVGLPIGAVWNNGTIVCVVMTTTPDPLAAPLFFNSTSPSFLLALGGGNLPLTNPGVVGQLWNNGGVVCIA